jgi:diguanylate cyclase (GGDEF)-like protein
MQSAAARWREEDGDGAGPEPGRPVIPLAASGPGGRLLTPAEAATLVVVAAITLCMLPFATHELGPTNSFVPAVMSSIFIIDVVTCFLLVTRFRDTGDRRLLALSLGYVWSGLMILGYVLAFPGVISSHPPLGSWPSTAPWMYLGWHVGFPVLLALAWCPWPDRLSGPVPVHRRGPEILWSFTAVGLGALAVVTVVAFAGPHLLPVLIHGTDTSRMSELAGPPGLVLGVTGAVIVTRGTRRRQGPERWVAITAWVCVADLLLTFCSLHRYSVGWYAGRAMTVVAVSLVFLAMLSEFTNLYRQLLSERASLMVAARTDPLTGLANRSVLAGALERRLRTGPSDWLVMLDLDRFKLINDTFGHPAGDGVLQECAQRLLAASRPDDLVARLGGDEFAVLVKGPLTRTEVDGFVVRMAAALREPFVVDRVWPNLVGASMGTTPLSAHTTVASAMRDADRELYLAKRQRTAAPRSADAPATAR